MSSYTFFFSYSTNDFGPYDCRDEHLDTFYRYLNKRVQSLSGLEKNGFMSRRSIESGHEWNEELIDALQSSSVLVCLYSPFYFGSRYCGKEMQVFLERRKRHAQIHGTKPPANIIPIYWQPCIKKIPRTIPRFQYKPPGNLAVSDYGLWHLFDRNKSDEFREVVEDAARRIASELHVFEELPLTRLGDQSTIDEVHSAFATPPVPLPEFDRAETALGPQSVIFVYSSGRPINAWPYFPPRADIALHVAASVAKAKDLMPHQLAFDSEHPDLTARLGEACLKNTLIFLLVDSGDLSSPNFRDRMREFDQVSREHRLAGLSTMILWKQGSRSPELEMIVRETFPYFSSRRDPHYYADIECADQLSERIHGAIAGLQSEIINNRSGAPGSAQPGPPTLTGPGVR